MVWEANELHMTAEFWEGCCKLPEMYPQHMKIRQGPAPPDFHIILKGSSKIFTNQVIRKHFNNCLVLESVRFIIWIFDRLGERSDTCICHYLIGTQLWLISNLRPHSSSGEDSLSLCVQSPMAQHWLSKELSTVPSYALQSSHLMVIFYLLTEGFQPWGIKWIGEESALV